ncbi:MAG: peptidoglycan-binding protein [Catenulispora sp.]|nr:peptidoglycan-binding protein [Catenulispora sp.]NUT40042.1 peptidoglycan-binding protein [Thermoactinospora sp.]
MTGRRFLVRALVGLVLAAGSLLAVASPASASSTPYCRYGAWMSTSGQRIYIAQSWNAWRCWMGYGAHSSAVGALQQSLNRCYKGVIGTTLRVDNSYGPRTRAALIRTQRYLRYHGFPYLVVDGVYGPQTALAMRHKAVTGCDTISHPGG